MTLRLVQHRNGTFYVRREKGHGRPAQQRSTKTRDEAGAHRYLALCLEAEKDGRRWPPPFQYLPDQIRADYPMPEDRVDIAFGGFATKVWKPECLGKYGSWRRTKEIVERFTRDFYGFALSEISKAQVKEWMTKRSREVAPGTVNREFFVLKAIYRHALEGGYSEFDPTVGVRGYPEPPPRKPHLDLGDERRLLEECVPWMRNLVACAIYTGCRYGELRRLVWGDVDFELGYITIRQSKNGDPRDIPIHPHLRPILLEMYGEVDRRLFRKVGRPYTRELVLTVGQGRRQLSKTGSSTTFKKYVRAIGREELRFHDLRHVFATRMLASGATLVEVADLLGHRSLAITRRYAHSDLSRMRKLMGGWTTDPGNPFRRLPPVGFDGSPKQKGSGRRPDSFDTSDPALEEARLLRAGS